ncbi:MAG: alpha/beta hydrolase [Hyphomicrobiales bacterium]|nr:alpha/beta hydrolase [Hyphomicrobiales bacterium]
MRAFIPITVVLTVLVALSSLAAAAGYRLASWKDDLFAYPTVLATGYGGDYVKVGYVEQRDLYQRDVVPEKKTKPEYVDLEIKGVEKDMTAREGRVSVKFVATGKVTGGAKAVVIYVHGRRGNRHQGANDWMFGGNFNRIKNLMARNGGVYLSPGFPSLGRRGVAQAKLLVLEYAKNSPGAPIFLACGSLGGRICWGLADDAAASKHIDGYLLMGSTSDAGFLQTDAFKRRVPVYLGHGTGDIVISWKKQEAFFKKVKQRDPSYPIKFALFDTGSHGTPIRMTDWRLILNWMLQVNGA